MSLSSPSPDHGVLTVSDAHGTWAWTSVRIDAAADLPELQEYADLSETNRRIKVIEAETAWLAGQWDPAHGSRIELRYLTDPATRRLSCALLGRTFATDRETAVAAALALRVRLSAPPRHVHAGPETDTDKVARWLTPFSPDPRGVAEIRKQYRSGRPQRPDSGVHFYQVPQPFTVAMPSWESVWQALITHPSPVMLTVGLEPCRAPAGFGAMLQELATHYGRLASPGQMPDGLWSSGMPLAPDSFAVDAVRIYSDAARRYTDRAFRIRIALASPAPLPEPLLELIGSTISPPELPGTGSSLTSTLSGSAHLSVRPYRAELDALWHNLTTLEQAPWGGDSAWQLPAPLTPQMRLLADLVDTREAAAAFRLPLATHGHMPGFPVRRPGLPTESDYNPTGPQITLGHQLIGITPAGPLGVAVEDLTRHALFVGTTGSGKTNTTLDFCEQLWRDHHIPFLVIEPVNTDLDDYRWLATRPGFEELTILTVGDESTAPFRLNPFEVPTGVRIGAHIAGLLACFDAAFGLWDPLPNLYNLALRATYARRGLVTTDTAGPGHTGRWPTLRDFVAEIRTQCEQLDYAGEIRSNIIAAARIRAESLAEGACASTLNVTRSYPIEELLSRPVVLELAGVGDNEKEQSLITALVLQTMTEHYKATRTNSGLNHVTVIEEAHRLLGRPPAQGDIRVGSAQARAAEAFANTLAENRKYGEGIVIVEQVPGKLVEDAYKNTNLKVMHRLPAEADRQLIGGTMRLTPDQERYAASLAPFHALVHHDQLDRPALVQIPNVRARAAAETGLERAPLATNHDLAQRFRALTTATPAVDAALAPFEECEGCAHRCLFRSRAATAIRSEQTTELKERAAAYPKDGAGQSAWWQTMASWVTEVGAPVAPTDASPEEENDYHACVFIHLVREAWENKTLPWTRRFRHQQREDA